MPRTARHLWRTFVMLFLKLEAPKNGHCVSGDHSPLQVRSLSIAIIGKVVRQLRLANACGRADLRVRSPKGRWIFTVSRSLDLNSLQQQERFTLDRSARASRMSIEIE